MQETASAERKAMHGDPAQRSPWSMHGSLLPSAQRVSEGHCMEEVHADALVKAAMTVGEAELCLQTR